MAETSEDGQPNRQRHAVFPDTSVNLVDGSLPAAWVGVSSLNSIPAGLNDTHQKKLMYNGRLQRSQFEEKEPVAVSYTHLTLPTKRIV